jgi:hypothetical protein
VVANETVAGRELLEEISRRARGRRAQVLVVAPSIIESRFKHALGDVDEAAERARERLERSLQKIRSVGLDARGDIGDADPNLAILDALRTFAADEVIISTHPQQRSTWLEKGVVERARREIDQPITHVVVDLEADRARRVARIPRRVRPRRGPEGEGDYLPPMPLRDRLTLLVGIPGTIALGVLAVICPDGGSFSGGCAARGMIALGAFMVTLWHSVALILMGSVRYRGFWSSAAADMVLWGIPPAIVVSLFLG